MPLLDLSKVTKVLVHLLRSGVAASEAWTWPDPPTLSPLPPDKLKDESGILGLYLYHVGEDAHYKTQAPAGTGTPPVRFTPMALNLYYLLTCPTGTDNDEGPYKAQLLMGCALKVLHDYPVITKSTTLGGVNVFDQIGLDPDNRLRIALQPISPTDAVTYYTAGDAPLRLSAYYQVSVVLLEPEPMAARPARELAAGPKVFPGTLPRLDASENTLTFTVPGEASARALPVRPAQVPLGETLRLVGSALTGDSTTLLVRSTRWASAIEVDGILWGVAATSDNLLATVQPSAGGETVLPGIYSAAVQVRSTQTLSTGEARTIVLTSNEMPFSVTPSVNVPSKAMPGDVVTLTAKVPSSTLFLHADIPTSERDARSVKVYLGAQVLSPRDPSGPPLAPGEFEVIDAQTLQIGVPTDAALGAFLPLRILVLGVESKPQWIEVAP